MAVTINIDTGGTFTDGVFTRDGRAFGVKAFSTPHDLTVGMLECVEAGAEALGLGVEEMLAEATAFRFSSTIVTNAIIERRGPRVGLLVSAGEERTLYGNAGLLSGGYVTPELVLGVAEPLDAGTVTAAVEELLDRGARVLAVSLRDSWRNPASERALRSIVRELYPAYYVGAVRVFLASDISALPGPAARTNTIVLNALVHAYLARSIYRPRKSCAAVGCAARCCWSTGTRASPARRRRWRSRRTIQGPLPGFRAQSHWPIRCAQAAVP
jgi:N-methylhydantoinase A